MVKREDKPKEDIFHRAKNRAIEYLEVDSGRRRVRWFLKVSGGGGEIGGGRKRRFRKRQRRRRGGVEGLGVSRCAAVRFERGGRVRARKRRRRAAAVTAAAAVEVVAADEVVELTIANVLAVLDCANVELDFLAGSATLAKHSNAFGGRLDRVDGAVATIGVMTNGY